MRVRGVLLLGLGLGCAEGRLGIRALRTLQHDSQEAAAGAVLVLVGLVLLGTLLVLALAFGWNRLRGRSSRPWAFLLPAAATAWALAVVPLPPSDFWANGGTEQWLAYLVAGGLAVPGAWVLGSFVTLDRGWIQSTVYCCLLSALVLLAAAATFDGYGSSALSGRALLGAGSFLLSAGALFSWWKWPTVTS